MGLYMENIWRLKNLQTINKTNKSTALYKTYVVTKVIFVLSYKSTLDISCLKVGVNYLLDRCQFVRFGLDFELHTIIIAMRHLCLRHLCLPTCALSTLVPTDMCPSDTCAYRQHLCPLTIVPISFEIHWR